VLGRCVRRTHHSIEHHLVALAVLDLVVQILGQVQALVNVLLEPNRTLEEVEQDTLTQGTNLCSSGFYVPLF
jgi:uncharacterized protein YoxC